MEIFFMINTENKLYIDNIEVYVLPKLNMTVTYKDRSKEKTGIIFDIQDDGKIILFKDSEDATDIHIAKLSTRKNSAVRGQWIENGITGKYAYTHKIILDKK